MGRLISTIQQYREHGIVINSTSSCADTEVLRREYFSYDQHFHNVTLTASRLTECQLNCSVHMISSFLNVSSRST